jgi:hypothetical protein
MVQVIGPKKIGGSMVKRARNRSKKGQTNWGKKTGTNHEILDEA